MASNLPVLHGPVLRLEESADVPGRLRPAEPLPYAGPAAISPLPLLENNSLCVPTEEELEALKKWRSRVARAFFLILLDQQDGDRDEAENEAKDRQLRVISRDAEETAVVNRYNELRHLPLDRLAMDDAAAILREIRVEIGNTERLDSEERHGLARILMDIRMEDWCPTIRARLQPT